jgi:hypothetical protein
LVFGVDGRQDGARRHHFRVENGVLRYLAHHVPAAQN